MQEQTDTRPAPGVEASSFHKHKRAAVESFLDFAGGGPMPQWPLEVFLEVSNICDLQCAMCPTFSALNPNRFRILKNNDRGLIPYEQATTPLESILEHALVVHAFGYGEPTIHPQFRDFIEYLARFEVMVDFFTHGMHLSEELCEFLVEKRVVRISVSFSGATQEEYENVYLGGDFQRVLGGMQTLAKAKTRHNAIYPAIHVNSLGFRHHVDKLPQFVRLMGEHGVNVIHLKPLQTYDEISELHGHSSIMRPDIEGEILAEAKRVADEYGLRLASNPYEQTAVNRTASASSGAGHKGELPVSDQGVEILTLKDIARSGQKKQHMRNLASEDTPATAEAKSPATDRFIHNPGTPCLEPFKTFYASFNGKIYPCCFKQDSGQPLGNLDESAGEAIWHGERLARIQQGALAREYPADLCARCLKAGTYPKSHALAGNLNQYSRWFTQAFGVPFHTHLLKAARALPDNEQIIAGHGGHGSRHPEDAD